MGRLVSLELIMKTKEEIIAAAMNDKEQLSDLGKALADSVKYCTYFRYYTAPILIKKILCKEVDPKWDERAKKLMIEDGTCK